MLKEIRMEKLEYTKNAMAIKWTTFGNMHTRFFEFHKGRKVRIIIKELLHEGQALLKEMDISQCV